MKLTVAHSISTRIFTEAESTQDHR